MTLADLKNGEKAIISKVKGRGAFRKRIIEMGFVVGKQVIVVKNAPLKDPIEYNIMGYEVSLRRSEASLIEVATGNGKKIPKNKKHLMDIGIAGPLIGLLVAVPVLFIGLSLSTVGPVELDLPEGYVHFLEGNSIFYLMAKYITFGKLLPQPASYGDLSPVLYWLRYFFTGSPAPLGGIDVQIHPVAWAGWAGLFVTAINLIPAGQLDGGHILYTLLGKEKAKRIFPIVLVALVIMGFFWSGWWLWAFLIFFIGRRYAEPMDQITPIDLKRKILGILALIVFVLLFSPVPLVIVQ